jgi:glycosyltransferase involved in cell wall biosynthesis
MEKINILYIINSLARGGTEKQLLELVENMDGSEFKPHIATLYPSTAFVEDLDVPSIQLDFKGFGQKTLYSQMVRLKNFTKQYDIHLVQTFFQDPHLLGAILRCCSKVKLIGSFRDMGFWRTFSGTAKIRLSDCLYDGYIANSEAVKTCSARSFGIDPDKIKCIYNGFDFSKNIAQANSTEIDSEEPKLVGIVANLNREVKRVEDFVIMASFVRARAPDVRFAVLGDGHLKDDLLNLSVRLGLGDSISFLGSVLNPLDYVARFHVGVLTSDSEGFSNSIIEYMACGVPVVATDVGGSQEIITPGENGYLVPTRSPALIAEKVIFLLENPLKSREIGLANQQKVLCDYTIDRMVVQHQEYYRKILIEHGRK